MGAKRQTTHRCPDRDILYAARNFHGAAELLWKERDAARQPPFAVPAVIHAVFALELYLKSLNAREVRLGGREVEPHVVLFENVVHEPRKRGHRLLELWKSIAAGVREHVAAVVVADQALGVADVETALERFEGVYEGWRYLFEGKAPPQVPTTDLFRLLAGFRQATDSLPHTVAVEA